METERSFIVDVETDSMDNHELKFQEFPHDHGADKYDSDSPSADTHEFTNFPNTAASDEEEGDKAQLLSEKKEPAFWTFEYYQQFFDVETHQVLRRILGSMLPTPRGNFLKRQIRSNPDLYGPFWVCATLVFTTAIAGNMANYIQSGSGDYNWHYNFNKVTLAATAIYSYWWLIPSILFAILWWRTSQAGYTFLEIICVYGYSLSIYIPISILWVIQVNWLQWVLVILGALLSGSVLLRTFWPAIRDDTRKVAFSVMAFIFILHAALAVGFVLYFFHVPSPDKDSTTTVSPHNISSNVTIAPVQSHVVAPAIDSQLNNPSGGSDNSILKPVNTNPENIHVKSRSNHPELSKTPGRSDTMKQSLRIGLNSMVSTT